MVFMVEFPAASISHTLGLVFSIFAAWKAANLLDANNRLLATITGAAFAIAGPLLIGDAITTALAGNDAFKAGLSSSLGSTSMQLTQVGSRLAFALIGVLAWCGIERR
jgi:hypothetical protein